jgi:hypothetical protein
MKRLQIRSQCKCTRKHTRARLKADNFLILGFKMKINRKNGICTKIRREKLQETGNDRAIIISIDHCIERKGPEMDVLCRDF